MAADTYVERLAEALGVPDSRAAWVDADREKIKDLARHLGVTYQAVAKIFDDGSKAMSAENNSKAAARLGVNSDWLAIGVGPKRRGVGPEFTSRALALAGELDALPPNLQERAYTMAVNQITNIGDLAREVAGEPPGPAPTEQLPRGS